MQFVVEQWAVGAVSLSLEVKTSGEPQNIFTHLLSNTFSAEWSRGFFSPQLGGLRFRKSPNKHFSHYVIFKGSGPIVDFHNPRSLERLRNPSLASITSSLAENEEDCVV